MCQRIFVLSGASLSRSRLFKNNFRLQVSRRTLSGVTIPVVLVLSCYRTFVSSAHCPLVQRRRGKPPAKSVQYTPSLRRRLRRSGGHLLPRPGDTGLRATWSPLVLEVGRARHRGLRAQSLDSRMERSTRSLSRRRTYTVRARCRHRRTSWSSIPVRRHPPRRVLHRSLPPRRLPPRRLPRQLHQVVAVEVEVLRGLRPTP